MSKIDTKAVEGKVAGNPVSGGTNLVVCAYEGTDDQLSKVWEKMTGVKPVVITVEPDADIHDILAGIIADNNISDDFILVPANCVPCAKIPSENWPHRLCSLTFKATRFSAKGCRNRSPRRNSWRCFRCKTRQRRSS